jgi:hypothetical protein
MKKVIPCLISILFIIWIIASVVDVNLHNQVFSETYQNFATWNLFTILHDFVNFLKEFH